MARPPQHGEIIAPTAGTDAANPDHFQNSFQDIRRFLAAGGRRGRQEQVLVEGTYFLNRLLATVEVTGKRRIEIGTVGVINSFVSRDLERALKRVEAKSITDIGRIEIVNKPSRNFLYRSTRGRSVTCSMDGETFVQLEGDDVIKIGSGSRLRGVLTRRQRRDFITAEGTPEFLSE